MHKKKDIWEVLVLGATFESKNIFKEVKEINTLYNMSEITEKEASKRVHDLEKRDSEFGLEISVIKENNKFGHESYGWGGTNKIILWDTDGVVGNEMYTCDINWCKSVAQLLCDSMNKKGM